MFAGLLCCCSGLGAPAFDQLRAEICAHGGDAIREFTDKVAVVVIGGAGPPNITAEDLFSNPKAREGARRGLPVVAPAWVGASIRAGRALLPPHVDAAAAEGLFMGCLSGKVVCTSAVGPPLLERVVLRVALLGGRFARRLDTGTSLLLVDCLHQRLEPVAPGSTVRAPATTFCPVDTDKTRYAAARSIPMAAAQVVTEALAGPGRLPSAAGGPPTAPHPTLDSALVSFGYSVLKDRYGGIGQPYAFPPALTLPAVPASPAPRQVLPATSSLMTPVKTPFKLGLASQTPPPRTPAPRQPSERHSLERPTYAAPAAPPPAAVRGARVALVGFDDDDPARRACLAAGLQRVPLLLPHLARYIIVGPDISPEEAAALAAVVEEQQFPPQRVVTADWLRAVEDGVTVRDGAMVFGLLRGPPAPLTGPSHRRSPRVSLSLARRPKRPRDDRPPTTAAATAAHPSDRRDTTEARAEAAARAWLTTLVKLLPRQAGAPVLPASLLDNAVFVYRSGAFSRPAAAVLRGLLSVGGVAPAAVVRLQAEEDLQAVLQSLAAARAADAEACPLHTLILVCPQGDERGDIAATDTDWPRTMGGRVSIHRGSILWLLLALAAACCDRPPPPLAALGGGSEKGCGHPAAAVLCAGQCVPSAAAPVRGYLRLDAGPDPTGPLLLPAVRHVLAAVLRRFGVAVVDGASGEEGLCPETVHFTLDVAVDELFGDGREGLPSWPPPPPPIVPRGLPWLAGACTAGILRLAPADPMVDGKTPACPTPLKTATSNGTTTTPAGGSEMADAETDRRIAAGIAATIERSGLRRRIPPSPSPPPARAAPPASHPTAAPLPLHVYLTGAVAAEAWQGPQPSAAATLGEAFESLCNIAATSSNGLEAQALPPRRMLCCASAAEADVVVAKDDSVGESVLLALAKGARLLRPSFAVASLEGHVCADPDLHEWGTPALAAAANGHAPPPQGARGKQQAQVLEAYARRRADLRAGRPAPFSALTVAVLCTEQAAESAKACAAILRAGGANVLAGAPTDVATVSADTDELAAALARQWASARPASQPPQPLTVLLCGERCRSRHHYGHIIEAAVKATPHAQAFKAEYIRHLLFGTAAGVAPLF